MTDNVFLCNEGNEESEHWNINERNLQRTQTAIWKINFIRPHRGLMSPGALEETARKYFTSVSFFQRYVEICSET